MTIEQFSEDIPLYQNREILYQMLIVEDKTNSQVAKELGCSYSAIQNWSSKLGVPRQEKWERLRDSHEEEVVKMYVEQRQTLQDIAIKFGYNDQTVKRVLEELGIKTRSRSEIKGLIDETFVYRKHNLNEDYFKTWSSEMAYILGFIAADGCIYTSIIIDERGKHRKHLLKINLQESDASHLEKIRVALEYEGEIKIYNASGHGKIKGLKYSSLDINSITMVNDIKGIGIRERKSLDKEIPISLPEEYELDYIRGYFDGNGSVGKQYPTNSKGKRTETCQIRVRISSGSYINLVQMQSILTRHGLKKKNVSSGKGNRLNVHEICYSTKESLMLFDLLYKDKSAMRLDRKHESFQEYVEQRKSDIKKSNGGIKVW